MIPSGDGTAVDNHHVLTGTFTHSVQGSCQYVFAYPAFTLKQYRDVCGGGGGGGGGACGGATCRAWLITDCINF